MDQSIICGISWSIDHRLSALTVQVGHTPHGGFNMKTNGKAPVRKSESIQICTRKKNHGFIWFPSFHHSIIPSFHDIRISNHLLGKPSLEHLIRDHHFSPSQHGIAWSISAGSGVFYELQRVDPLVGGLVFTRFCHVFVWASACTKISIGGSSKFLSLPKKNPESKYYFRESFTNPMFILRRSLILKC